MYYVYVLLMANDKLYIGYTPDLRSRLQKHHQGLVYSTKKHLPLILVYTEQYASEEDAKERERKLKQYGGAYKGLKRRIERSILKQRRRRD